MNNKKRFDDFPTVECNECEMYYTNRCDSANIPKKDSYSPCKSFLPIRNVTIPNDIKVLQKSVKWLAVIQTFLVAVALIEIARWIG